MNLKCSIRNVYISWSVLFLCERPKFTLATQLTNMYGTMDHEKEFFIGNMYYHIFSIYVRNIGRL